MSDYTDLFLEEIKNQLTKIAQILSEINNNLNKESRKKAKKRGRKSIR